MRREGEIRENVFGYLAMSNETSECMEVFGENFWTVWIGKLKSVGVLFKKGVEGWKIIWDIFSIVL